MTIKIITDSGADLPKEYLERHDISIVPLSVHFDHEKMPSDMEAPEFYKKMRETKALPTTASPSPYDFLEKFKSVEDGTDILVMCLSSNISSTYQNALIAKEMYLDEGHTNTIEVLDTKTFSLGLGLLVALTAKMAHAGTSFQELKQWAAHQAKEVRAYFTLDTLENVIKGGRLDRLRGTVASVLNIKLLMRISEEGTVEVVEKNRGMQASLNSLIKRLEEKQHNFEKAVLAVCHSNCEERARDVIKAILAKYPFCEVILSDMGPIIGTYAGEGGIGVAF
ncbi:DegV family protein [Gorillibacterium timonense]|uniref:DegV family protein n=1 Tax=Gorillibacterium timonense TaxID=1689269 RepID=UPI00071E395D|nr:DegV family protein [Gorillibacterium timonense]